MYLAFLDRHWPRRRIVLALLAGTLALAGCSELTGDDRTTEIAEVALVNAAARIYLTAGRGGASGRIFVRNGEDLPLQLRLFGENGVPVQDPEAYRVSVVVVDPRLASWTSSGDRSFAFAGLANGYTTFRVDVLRGDSVAFKTRGIGLEVY